MEVRYSLKLGEETHVVKATCFCGKCSLLSTEQLKDLRQKVKAFQGKESPEEIKVICNA